jgi:hypothetical protein
MSEPRRLLEEGGSEFERLLLSSAQKDVPSSSLRPKTLAALGLGVGVVGVSATATAAATVAKAAPTALVKWIGFGLASGLLVVAAVGLAPSLGSSPTKPAAIEASVKMATPTSTLTPPAPADLSPPAVAEAPSSLAEQPAPAEATSGKKPDAPRAHASAEPQPSPLTEEIASLDVAREALAAGNAARALQDLDQHDRDFPRALLGHEATVLRIEALTQRGDHASAARLGTAFLAAHPRSPHASHIRSLIGATGEASGASSAP